MVEEDENERERKQTKNTKREQKRRRKHFSYIVYAIFILYLEHGLCLIVICGLVFSSSSRSSDVSFNGVELLDGEQWLISGMAKGECDGVDDETEQQRSSNVGDETLSWFDVHDDCNKCVKGLK